MKEWTLSELARIGVTPSVRGELPIFCIANRYADAEISLYGAQVLSFVPRGEKELLWISEKANFQEGKAIRGGIPVCWPWFGAAGNPAHGVARLSRWQFADARIEADESTTMRFFLDQKKFCALTAELSVNVGSALRVSLTTENCGRKRYLLSEALHTYFSIQDIQKTFVYGLLPEDVDAGDLAGGRLSFTAETDLMCAPRDKILVIDDQAAKRRIRIERAGSRSAVIWNPWIDKAKCLADFGDGEYRTMLCVEAANVKENSIELPPGATHTLQTRISLL